VTVELGQTKDVFTEEDRKPCEPRNPNISFPPLRSVLRGCWSQDQLVPGERSTENLHLMPDIPGQHVAVDGSRRKATVSDPLAGNESLLRRISRARAALGLHPVGSKATDITVAPEPTQEHVLDDTGIKTWLYWLRRFVDYGLARVTAGQLPTTDEISRLPGKTRVQCFDSGVRRATYLEDQTPILAEI
jgi:hypothetical protein